MCRIGSIKSREPVPPSLALKLMIPQQEGHDNSGFAMVMQDLDGAFRHYKKQPLLSMACTARGVQLVNEYTSVKMRMDEEEERWTQLSEELESLA